MSAPSDDLSRFAFAIVRNHEMPPDRLAVCSNYPVATAHDLGIKYPVAMDNEYAIWNAYKNEYWPAHYLIDAQGHIRDQHFGEGKYQETELMIQALLKEVNQGRLAMGKWWGRVQQRQLLQRSVHRKPIWVMHARRIWLRQRRSNRISRRSTAHRACSN